MEKEHASFVVLVSMALLVSSVVFITNYEEVLASTKPAEFDFNLPEFKAKEMEIGSGPELPEESPEIEQETQEETDYEQDYLEGSRYMNLSHDFGLFETKLVRIGWYKNPEEGLDEITFRADIWVRNAGNSTENFKEDNAFIQKVSNQTYNVTETHFNGENIEPGEEREGYILFENVPYDLSGEVRFSIGTSRAYSSLFGIQIHSPHIYIISL
ncbi:MAG: hypothetical protein R6U26_03225 [Candidatus Undinarchaeales archaeon]